MVVVLVLALIRNRMYLIVVLMRYLPQLISAQDGQLEYLPASQTENYCAAVSTTPARVFESQQPNHPYETINVGDTSYTKGMAPVKHYTEVLVDGAVTGNRYYK